MPDWDEDSPELRQNLDSILEEITTRAEQRETPTVELARRWQRRLMQDLHIEPRYVGAFRGEPGFERIGVRIGAYMGTPPTRVAEDLKEFEGTLQQLVSELDKTLPIGKKLTPDECDAVIDLCAWAHAKWIRIHPFANGNGRTARLWANFLLVRYGLPPFIRLRPRPRDGYEQAGAQAMQGNWEPTATVFRRALKRFLDEAAD